MHEHEGRLADPTIQRRLRKLSRDGYNMYVVAQPTRPLPAEGHFTRNADVTGVRCIYADGDESETLPAAPARVIRAKTVEEARDRFLWESRGLKAKFSNVVYAGGFLYGLDDGILVCLDPESGERRWKRGRYGHGQIMLVDDLLLVLGEDGTVALVEASPEAYREVSRFPALEGKTWNHPALAGPYLLVRNDHEAACYELPLALPVGEDA